MENGKWQMENPSSLDFFSKIPHYNNYMHSLPKRLIVVLFLTFLIFFPKLVFSDWGSDTEPPTVTATITCGGVTQPITGNLDCGGASATITVTYSKSNGLVELTHSVSSNSGTPTLPSCNSPSPYPSPRSLTTTTCNQIPPTTLATYKLENLTSSVTVTASAKDGAGNIGTATSGSSFTLSFVKYSIQGAIYVDANKNGTKDTSPAENPYTSTNSTIQVRIANSSFCSGALVTSVGTNGTITTSNGTYDTGQNLVSGSYDICYTSLPTSLGYGMTQPQGARPSRTVTVGPSATNINFGITNSTTWFQGVGGDMRLDGGFTDRLPSGKKASEDGAGGTPGIVFTGASTAALGSGQASSKSWLVGGTSYPETVTSTTGRVSYSYLLARAGTNTIDIATKCNNGSSGNISNCTLPANLARGVYKAEGNLVLNAWSPTGTTATNFVILAAGDGTSTGGLTIKGNIIIPNGFTAVFSAKDNIKVDKTVGETTASSTTSNIQGFFSADKDFILESYGGCAIQADRRLNVQGALVANANLGTGSFQNNRDLCGGNTNNPSLYIVERVDFILNAPAFVRRTPSVWREVPPGPSFIAAVPTPTPTITPTPTPTPTPTLTPTPTTAPTPTPTPSPTPTLIPVNRVFITGGTTTYNGDLGGLDGGDSKCRARATSASLGGTWKAWLSIGPNDGESPDTRFTKNIFGPYKLVDNTTLIANNWSDLINNGPRNKIEKDESGTVRSSQNAWTNTRKEGTVISESDDCGDFTDSNVVATGFKGNNNYTEDGRWTFHTTISCGASIRLYCFEQ